MITYHTRAAILCSLFVASAVVWANEVTFRPVTALQAERLDDPFLARNIVNRSRYFVPAITKLRDYLAEADSSENGSRIEPLTIELFSDLRVSVRASEIRKNRTVWVAYFEGESLAQGESVTGVLTLFPDDQIVGNFSSSDFYVGVNFSREPPYHFVWEAVEGYTIPVD